MYRRICFSTGSTSPSEGCSDVHGLVVVGASTQPPHQYPFLVSGLWDGEQVQLTEGCPDEHRLVVEGASFRNITITSVHGEQVQLTEDCPDEHRLVVEGASITPVSWSCTRSLGWGTCSASRVRCAVPCTDFKISQSLLYIKAVEHHLVDILSVDMEVH